MLAKGMCVTQFPPWEDVCYTFASYTISHLAHTLRTIAIQESQPKFQSVSQPERKRQEDQEQRLVSGIKTKNEILENY